MRQHPWSINNGVYYTVCIQYTFTHILMMKLPRVLDLRNRRSCNIIVPNRRPLFPIFFSARGAKWGEYGIQSGQGFHYFHIESSLFATGARTYIGDIMWKRLFGVWECEGPHKFVPHAVWSESLLFAYKFMGCYIKYLQNLTKTFLYNFNLLKPHFYVLKLGFTGVYIVFLISAQKHRLWVLTRTVSLRQF